MSLVAGAWSNPWYSKSDFAKSNNTTFVSLASFVNWSQDISPSSGFTKAKVDYFRGKTNAKVLVSFGGSSAANLWSTMAGNPTLYSNKITDFLSSIGADGIDYDYETELSQSTSNGLKAIMEAVSKKGFTQTLSVLAGSYDLYKPIIDANVVDNIIVMCYNGGIFTQENPLSGKWDWKQWMNFWIEKVGNDQKSKLVIGMCIQYSPSIVYYTDQSLVKEGVTYCKANSIGGIFFWWYSDDSPGAINIGSLIDLVNS